MSVCFIYVNLDRQEYFSTGALGGGMKKSSLGRNLEARALGLLLMERSKSTDGRVEPGAWAGNRVIAAGDGDAPPNTVDVLAEEGRSLYEHACKHYRDIRAAIALMMLCHERDALLDAADSHADVFILLGELAHVHRCDNVARALQERFGADWLKSYGRRRKEFHRVIPPP